MLSSLRLLLCLGTLMLLLSPGARASHAQGGELTYEAVGYPNRYKVICRFFRDCSGPALSPQLTLNCRVGTSTTSCSSTDPRNFTATLVSVQSITGTPYCSSVGNQCGATGRPNYELTKYEAIVTLPPAPAWTLSVVETSRPTLANIAGNNDLYLEATLNNQITLPGGTTQTITNNAPQYFDQHGLMPLVCVRQTSTLSFAADEPDGDSVVYTLDRPLEGCNQPAVYRPFHPSAVDPVSSPTPCVIALPPIQAYSPTFPLPSFTLSGSCPVITATPFFTFQPRQGTFTFQPAGYDPANQSNNKFAVVGKVTEYRKIYGRYYLVGSVRREMVVVVTDCGTNQVPNPPSLVAGQPGPAVDSVVVETPVLTTKIVDFHFSDPNASDLLTVSAPLYRFSLSIPYANLYTNPAAPDVPISILSNGTTAPVLRVRLRPHPSSDGTVFYMPVQVEDNACPIKAVRTFMLILRVRAAGPTATQTARQRGLLSAFPNPFSEQITFRLPRPQTDQHVLVYDALGRVVAQLPVPAGNTAEVQLTWTPAPTTPAGVYLVRLPGTSQTLRLLRQ